MRSRFFTIVKLFIAMLLVYTLLRVAFLLTYFSDVKWTTTELVNIFYWGARLDFSSLFYLNLPFLLYYFFVEAFIKTNKKKTISIVLFCLLNLSFLAINFIDLVYYYYNHRRSTVDLADVFADSSSAFGSFLSQYWYVLLIFLITATFTCIIVKRIIHHDHFRPKRLMVYFSLSVFFLLIAFGFARGFSKRPILTSTPLLYVDSRYQPLVNNSTFNFLQSVLRKQTVLEKKEYFSEQELNSILNIHHQYQHDSAFNHKNVVIFVLESFSKELFAGHRQASKMPFFDSLMRHSTVCNNAFCNALESNKGLPAILASLPDVMDEPIYLSNYNNLPFKGIGHILKEQGYSTSFFMGAEYDHFGFARLCKMVGIDEYYSGTSYGKHPEQFDGTWGIYDEYFFNYFQEVVSKKKQPFFSVLFNLSSHPPYNIPAETAKKIQVPGQQPWQNGATYVDHCYNQLFQKIKTQPWFNNTIFVFVADHGFRFTRQYDNIYTELRIPLFIYNPKNHEYQSINKPVKQLDIVPTILDQLNYPAPFTSFGTSMYQPTTSFSINRVNGIYQYIDSSDFIGYDDKNEQPVFNYHYRQDSALQYNLLKTNSKSVAQKLVYLKAFIQKMNNSLINNKLD